MKRHARDHGIRDKIIDLVNEKPGVHLRAVARELDIHVNLADYHLRILEKATKVLSVEKGGRKGFFPSSIMEGKVTLGPVERRILLFLREARTFLIIIYLLVTDGARSGEVAREVEISPSTATHHLKRLTKEGIIDKRPDTKEYAVIEPELVARIIIDHRPGEEDMVDSFESLWEEISRNLE